MTDHRCLTFPADDPVAQRLGLGVAALRYQQMGYSVLPLAPRAKKPHRMLGETGGVHWATRDPAMPEWAWKQDRAAGIGIACGQASQLLVIDLDVKGEHDGIAELTRWWLGDDWGSRAFVLAQAFPGAPVAVTPSDGRHIYLRTPPGRPVGQRIGILPGVDIKGDGGYVAAAPTMTSIHTLSGETILLPYSWADGCPCSVPWAPEWIFEWIASVPEAAGGGNGSAGDGVDVDGLRETGLERGSRNVSLHRLACSLYARYGTGPAGQQAVAEQVRAVLDRTDMAGFSQHEVKVCLESALRWVQAQREAEDRKLAGVNWPPEV